MGAAKVVYSQAQGKQIPTGFNPGPGTTVVGQGIYDTSSTKKHTLGERLQIGERVFYYAQFTAAGVAGMLAQGDTPTNIQKNLTVPTVTDGSNAAGQNKVTVTMATDSATADFYADGYLTGYDGSAATGQGQTYKIKSNEVATAGGALKLTLYDDLVVLFTAGTAKCSVTRNKYAGMDLYTYSARKLALGVPLVAVTATHFAWLQTYGPCAVLNDAVSAFVIGDALCASVTVSGSVGNTIVASAKVYQLIGFAMDDAATSKYGLVDLKISF